MPADLAIQGIASSFNLSPRPKRSDTARRHMRSEQAGHTPWVGPTTTFSPRGNRTTNCFTTFLPTGKYHGPSLTLLHQAHCVRKTQSPLLLEAYATPLNPRHLHQRTSRRRRKAQLSAPSRGTVLLRTALRSPSFQRAAHYGAGRIAKKKTR